jgi:hypothetical protein
LIKLLQIIFLVIFLFGIGIVHQFYQFGGDDLSVNYNIIEENNQSFLYGGETGENVYTLFVPEKEDQGLRTSIGFALFNISGLEYLVYTVFINTMNFDHKRVKSSLVTSDNLVIGVNLTAHYIPGQLPDEVVRDPNYKHSKLRMSRELAIWTNFNPVRKTSLNWFVVPPKYFGSMRNKSKLIAYKLIMQDKEYIYKFNDKEAEIIHDLINMFPCTYNCPLTERKEKLD